MRAQENVFGRYYRFDFIPMVQAVLADRETLFATDAFK